MLAHAGRASAATLEVLVRLKESGRRLPLVTGRELPDLRDALPEMALFDRVAEEDGAIGAEPPPPLEPKVQEVLVWQRGAAGPPRPVAPGRPRQAHKRHTRKYAEGDFGEASSFPFRGALNLRAQNLQIFLQTAQGVDADTWEHRRRAHCRRGGVTLHRTRHPPAARSAAVPE